MWGLADCNNFFVSCERTQDASLRGRAVIVLSNNDGCAIARSNEAKKLGIRMGQPAFELRDMIREGKVIALSGNHILYRRISLRVHEIISRFVPRTLDYSVDESFLDMNGLPESSLREIAENIVLTVDREVNIPLTVGIAPTKTLCKVAAEIGKKRGEPVKILLDRVETENELRRLDIRDVWGIGRRLARKLYSMGVYNAYSLSIRDGMWVRDVLGVNGEKTWRELNGQPCIELSHVDRELQDSISETRTFPNDENDYDYIRSRIVIYASDCCRRLRGMKGRCMAVTVFLRTNRFHPEKGVDCPTFSVCLPIPSNDTNIIIKAALDALDRVYSPRYRYKRAGVILSEITGAECYTPSLFDTHDRAERRQRSQSRPALMNAIDRINKEIGCANIRLASQLTAGQPGHNDGYSSSFGAPGKNR